VAAISYNPLKGLWKKKPAFSLPFPDVIKGLGRTAGEGKEELFSE
jgi:hypothetical protein